MSHRSSFLILLILLAGAGCDEGNGPGPVPASLEEAWPHADGSAWSYETSVATYRLGPKDGVGPRELPSLEELHRDLDRPVPGPPEDTYAGIYTLTFDGVTTTSTGVEAQNLAASMEPVPEGAVAPAPMRDPSKVGFRVFQNTFLRGGAFAYEDTGLYTYNNLDADHAWTYLEGELQVGREFSLQVAKTAVDDMWLLGRIWSVGTRTLNGVRYRDLVECMYRLDLGAEDVVDEAGNVVGTEHDFAYGQVFYAPGIGPVYALERSWGRERTAYAPEGTGFYFVRTIESRLADHHLAEP